MSRQEDEERALLELQLNAVMLLAGPIESRPVVQRHVTADVRSYIDDLVSELTGTREG